MVTRGSSTELIDFYSAEHSRTHILKGYNYEEIMYNWY